ncbi:MAG: serine/threonine-protein kinase, partial [Actinomycetota bacterium]
MFDDDANPPPHDDAPRVPGLDVLGVVARGGHGTVYEATQREHDRVVALKVLDARFDDEVGRRFDRERTALGRISDHPSIVSLLDSGRTADGAPYLLLEFAPGGSLADRLEAGPLDLDEATSLVVELAAATERAHEAGIVHRDIKPGNVLRSAYGQWMLTDFGIASLTDRSLTATVQVSYAHTAPEVFESEPPSPEGDVYSLASLLATCLTGIEPFEMGPSESNVSVMRRIMTEPYPDVRPAGVPDDLAVLLEMALSKDPGQRPVSAQAFAAAINEFRGANGLQPVPVRTGATIGHDSTVTVADDDLAAVPSWSSGPAGEPERAPRRGLRLLVAVACLAALVAGLGSFLPSVLADTFDGPVAAVPFDGAGDDADGIMLLDGDLP